MNIKPSVLQTMLWAAVLLITPAGAGAQEVDDLPHGPWFRFHRDPAMSVVYGTTRAGINGLSTELGRPGIAELKLGGANDDLVAENFVIQHRYDYLTVANVSTDLGRAAVAGEAAMDNWRWGAAWEKGYGYRLSGEEETPALILYKTDGLLWTHLNVKGDLAKLPGGDLLAQFEDGVRFGTKMEAGVRFRVSSLLVFDAGFERSVTFRRHVFWPWLGGVALEGAGRWLMDRFVDRILDTSPAAAPVINFLLKNGLSFAAYQLRRERMYAPFSSEPPLFMEGFKFGVSFFF